MSLNKQGEIRLVLNELNNRNIRYLVLRRHEKLPSAIPGSQEKVFDIDVLIDDSQFNEAIGLLNNLGYSRKRTKRISVVKKAVKNPSKALKVLVNSPTEVIHQLGISIPKLGLNRSPDEWASEGSYIYLMEKDGLVFDIRNHLTHKSYSGSKLIRLNPELEEQFLYRRKKRKMVYYPHPSDELTHLIGRIIFTYEGNPPQYYLQRCDKLRDIVYEDNKYLKIFQSNLSLIYYNATKVVMRLVDKREYAKLRNSIVAFSDY